MANATGDAYNSELLTMFGAHDVEAVVSLDKEIERFQRDISQRRQRRNALQPISHLPPEILIQVFKLLRTRYYSSFYKRSGRGVWNWIILTRICVYWRKLVIEAPTFWTKIRQRDSIKRIKIFLERSQDAELEVELREDDLTRGAFDLIWEHIRRVKQLGVYIRNGSHLWNSLQALFTDPNLCGVLNILTINSLFYPYTPMQLAWLHNETPVSLDRLELRCVSTAWNHSIFRGLRTLVIHDLTISSPVPQNSTFSLSQLLDILDSCGALKELDLRRAGPLFSSLLRDRIIDLPQLEKIAIREITFKTYLSLFQHIRLSKIASCYIDCLDYDFDTTPTLVAPSLKQLLPNRYGSLSVEISEKSIEFSLSQKRGGLGSECELSIKLSMGVSNFTILWRDRYKQTIESIPRIVKREVFANAEETKIYLNKNLHEFAVEIEKTLWINLLKNIPKFKILTIRKAAPYPLDIIIDALADIAQNYTPQRPSFSIPLELNFIFVRGFGAEVNSNLFKYLRLRKTIGFPVKSLMVLECSGIDETDLQAVEDVVEKVVYHRYRRPF